MLSLLIFIGEAVRDAFDPRKTLPLMALLEVEDLSVTFASGTGRSRPSRASRFALDRGETLAHRRRERLGQVGDRALDPAAAALSHGRRIPSGSIRFDGAGADRRATSASCARSAAAAIGMIFQEPMTSLNPLHTVERQIGEVLCVHRGLRPRGGARARARAAAAGAACRSRSSGSAPTRTSCPAASASA